MGNTRVAAVAGAMAAALLAAGCGPGGAGTGSAPAPVSGTPAASGPAAPASTTGPFGRRAVYDEIMAVVTAAELRGSGTPGIGGPTPGRTAPAPTPTTEKERVAERAMACSAVWATYARPADGTGDRFDEAITDLRWRGWSAGEPREEKIGDKGDTMRSVALRKRGWTLNATHQVMREMVTGDNLLFIATEDACMKRFTARELELLEEGPGREGEQP
ncbi:hypothetical protein [Streptomyces sp. NPDC058855]|uniref:hypothetical protein n=1 Tax=Streptomyces sp. NPDC058855 TaxID=3346651 RepID=UPI0036966518